MTNRNRFNPIDPTVITFDEAIEQGWTSSQIATLARSLERLSKDCFTRLTERDFSCRLSEDLPNDETPASLVRSGKMNQQAAYVLRKLSFQMKKAGF